MANVDDPRLRKRFEDYMKAMPKELDALERAAKAQSLDYTYESLDRLEDFLDITNARETDDDALFDRVSRYLGSTLVKRAGGKWDYSRVKDDSPGEPLVTGLPHLGKRRFFPMSPVDGYRHESVMGLLRDAVEPFDVAYRRQQMLARVARIDAEIEELRAEVRQALGVSAGDLDFSLDSADTLETALLAALSAGASRERERSLRSRAALYLGKAVERAAGGGDWTLCEDPVDVDFGELIIHEWAPFTLVKNVDPTLKRRLLRLNLEKVIRRVSRSR